MKQILWLVIILWLSSLTVCARDLSNINPPYPRIANCYGSALGWQTWEQGKDYWSKLDLFIGGCFDLHYDWDNPRWSKVLAHLQQNIAELRKVNPNALVLPYVDVIEGQDNPNIPQAWWDLRNGKRWSGWPGMFRINMTLPDVLQYNLDKVRDEVMARDMFDGVFYDCWHPDPWLVPRTAQLRGGKAIVTVNNWNLPTQGFSDLNGCLAEDEINRVAEGKVDFEDFLARYLRWTRESRKPVTTTIVGHPRGIDMNEWHWAKVDWKERKKLRDQLETKDPQMMRFGLTTTLLGDGYFAYDTSNMGRGDWWWYPEFDAPLGYPKGAASHNADGTWRRDFDGGLVVVNGTRYDVAVSLPRKYRDISTGRVGTRFTLWTFDGRIFVPTDAPATPGKDAPPRLTSTPPTHVRAARLDANETVAQTPGGLELRFNGDGELQAILLHGKSVMTGGWPVVASPPMSRFAAADVQTTAPAVSADSARIDYSGQLVDDNQRVSYAETCTVQPINKFTLHFDFEALTDLDLRMWRHYFFFPIRDYAGATAHGSRSGVTLPAALGDESLLSASKHVQIQTKSLSVTVDSSLPLTLIDHRKWGTQDYLLAGYPVNGKVKQGTKWSVEITTTVTPRTGQ